jgi:hypothetical protein
MKVSFSLPGERLATGAAIFVGGLLRFAAFSGALALRAGALCLAFPFSLPSFPLVCLTGP